MVRKLRVKFILAAMLSLIAVLSVIIIAVNMINYHSIVDEADKTISILMTPGNFFGEENTKPIAPFPRDKRPISPEMPYETRFFTVSYDGERYLADIGHIAAVDSNAASIMAEKVLNGGKFSGFLNNYRFLVTKSDNQTKIIFLDCTRPLSNFRTFLTVSCLISLAGLLGVFILLVVLSGRIIKPLAVAFEKQKRFITDAGHEIKTPLTVISADTDVLEMEIGENEWLQDIRKQTAHLSRLTHNLIYLSRMQEENTELKKIDFPLSDVVNDIALSFQAICITQDKQFSIDIENAITFNGDEHAVRQLITILLDNAVKYSEDGGYIRVSLVKQNRFVCLSVENSSLCINREDLPHIFDRFYRVDSSRNSKSGGYGIGLSIAKAVVDSHKGKITATVKNQSVIFNILLPI